MGISFSRGLFSGATFVLGRVMSSLPHYTVNCGMSSIKSINKSSIHNEIYTAPSGMINKNTHQNTMDI